MFGQWNYILSIVLLFGPFISFGTDSILMQKSVLDPLNENTWLWSGFHIRLFGSILAFIFCIAAVLISNNSISYLYLVMVLCLSFFSKPIEISDVYFRIHVISKYTAWSKIIGLFISFVAKVLVLMYTKNLMLFGFFFSFDYIISSWLSYYFLIRKNSRIKYEHFDRSRTFLILKESLPLFVSILAYTIYARIDVIMIGNYLTTKDVGVYSASIKILDMVIAMLLVISSTLFPVLSQKFKSDKMAFFNISGFVSSLLTLAAYIGFILFLFIGKKMVFLMFGTEFLDVYEVFIVHLLGLIFLFNGTVRSSMLIILGKQKFVLISSVMSAIINIILNYILIPEYGIIGAASASAFTHFISLFLINILFSETRDVFLIQLKSLFCLYLFKNWQKYYK